MFVEGQHSFEVIMLVCKGGLCAGAMLLVLVLPQVVATPRAVRWPLSVQPRQQILDQFGVEPGGTVAELREAAIVIVRRQNSDREVGPAEQTQHFKRGSVAVSSC